MKCRICGADAKVKINVSGDNFYYCEECFRKVREGFNNNRRKEKVKKIPLVLLSRYNPVVHFGWLQRYKMAKRGSKIVLHNVVSVSPLKQKEKFKVRSFNILEVKHRHYHIIELKDEGR